MSELINAQDFTKQLQEMNEIIRSLPETVAKRAAKTALSRYGRAFVGAMAKSIGGSVTDRDVLHRRTGALARAFNHSVVQEGSATHLYIWLDDSVKDYWKTQEYWATIRAKNGRMLAIPAKAAMTAAGVSRYKSPRELPDLFVIKKDGRAMLGRREGNKIVVYFYLKNQVEVKQRLGFRKRWMQGYPQVREIYTQELQNAVSARG